jgi:hypothetical protein
MVLTGITAVGGIIVFPLIIEYLRQHLALVACGVFVLILLYALTPYSPEARAIWAPVSAVPQTFVETLFYSADAAVRQAR